MKRVDNGLPKVVGFPRVLQFPPIGDVDRVDVDLLQVSLSLLYRSTIVYITWRSTERRSEKERLVNFGKSRFKTEPKMQDLL